ncbi:hypothetical protein LR48_Vigan04g159000 [Vigna angularis]|uniref:Uncharacterized protein n=1 Tax=Phaseolus angularis TaxID=3914 RepID=A0A0L9UFP4_PHAAN|nr:hypothetical protein LR48_Vigan04g159000 [Vigna angularis]
MRRTLSRGRRGRSSKSSWRTLVQKSKKTSSETRSGCSFSNAEDTQQREKRTLVQELMEDARPRAHGGRSSRNLRRRPARLAVDARPANRAVDSSTVDERPILTHQNWTHARFCRIMQKRVFQKPKMFIPKFPYLHQIQYNLTIKEIDLAPLTWFLQAQPCPPPATSYPKLAPSPPPAFSITMTTRFLLHHCQIGHRATDLATSTQSPILSASSGVSAPRLTNWLLLTITIRPPRHCFFDPATGNPGRGFTSSAPAYGPPSTLKYLQEADLAVCER